MPRSLGTPLKLSLLLILGVALAQPINQPALFLTAAIAACLLALVLTWRATPDSSAPTLAFLTAWTCAAAAWGALHLHTQSPDTIARYVHPDRPCLVHLRGQVDEPILVGQPPTGPMAEFFHRPPDTSFRFNVLAIRTPHGWQPATGTLLARIGLVDRRLRPGLTIEATGWLKPLSAPRNPGEFDPRPLWQRDNVQARLTLSSADDWQPAEHAASPWSTLRNFARQRARTSLLTSLPPHARETSFLDTLLLGSSARPIADVYDNFRQLGLAHLLAISGAHLIILLWFVWWIAKGLTHRPALAGAMVLIVLLSYLFILPGRAAILRAGIMSGLYGLAFLTGWAYRWRQPEPRSLASSLPDTPTPHHRHKAPLFELWAVSVILVLLWRPTELFEPGTQLSFGVVAGLILWGAKARHWLSPDQAQRIQQAMGPTPHLRQPSLLRLALDHLRRAFLDFIATSLVALVVAGPIVAYHFQIITPLALPLGLLIAPLVMATLVLGYLKMMLGLLLPGLAAWVIPTNLLESLVRAQIDLAAWAADLPATHLGAIHLPRQPTLTWTFAALILGAAVLSGRFKRRPLLITTAVLLVTLWLALESFVPRTTWPAPEALVPVSSNPSIKLTALDLGPGRCLIMQSRQGFSRHTAVIDAGSRQWPSVGRRAILPALIDLGVRRIDTLILTSPTLEHLS
ncbi:MAG: ComEC/Rec2 family competence protein, partial [Phycisphaeraceae bacterium]|nr:ComEC/Rec2 family competence protein [Phycisphaeraceae bacterium]